MGKRTQLWFGRRMNASRREAGSHSGRWAERETHRSLRAAGGGEPLSPDIHPIIIKLSLQGGAEGCLQRQPTRKQEGRRHQIHSCWHPARHDGNTVFSSGGRKRKNLLNSRTGCVSESRQTYQKGWQSPTGSVWGWGISLHFTAHRLDGVLINPESCLVVVVWPVTEGYLAL